ncbi:helix-turn-helix domain-containing protein [Bacillus thuringiensis]|uniref:helix-turn-helix domain-containing protein n=1 Tax=Bacillus thuringiensis TaxID=1428 RepID=UPI000CD841AF|nr:helix-turn-helix domain-containing protein [Bacillus thuringiensis]QFQ28580.1 helix-turn-helix domain-containing protein [Bacillus thuringiensis]
MVRIKYSKAEKLAILALYKDGHHSIADITAKFSVNSGTIRDWKRRYEVNGKDGLEEAISWKRYSKDLIEITEQISQKGAHLKSLKESWLDTTTAYGKMLFTISAGVAQFKRDLTFFCFVTKDLRLLVINHYILYKNLIRSIC